MQIAFVTQPIDPVLPPRQNSIGLIVHHTARVLARNHSVTIYANSSLNERSRLPDDGINYRFIPCQRDESILRLLSRFPSWIDQKRIVASDHYYRVYAEAIARDLEKRNYDWVHIVNFSNFVPILRRRLKDTRIALEMQCEWLTQLSRPKVHNRIQYADLITGSSGHITKLISERFPEYRERCHTLYNGFDGERFANARITRGAKERPRSVLFVGRLSPEKGIHTLFEAMSQVVTRRPDCRLDLVGSTSTLPMEYIIGISQEPSVKALRSYYDGTICNDYQAYLRQRAENEPLRGKVRFVGTVPQADLPAWYAGADVLANPSFSESFGMSLVEGMATGLPVVATRVGGMKEIVQNGVTGYLEEPGNAEGIAAALLDCLDSSDRRDALGSAGRRRALELFSWSARCDRLVELYQTTL